MALGLSTATTRFPQNRTCPFRPPVAYDEIDRSEPVSQVRLWNDRIVWLVTGADLARSLLQSDSLSADRTVASYPSMSPGLEPYAVRRMALIGEDPPAHDAHRALVNSHFTMRRAKDLLPELTSHIHGLIDDLVSDGPPSDISERVCASVPRYVMSRILGIPESQMERFMSLTSRVMRGSGEADSSGAVGELLAYLTTLVEELSRSESAGLLGELAAKLDSTELEVEEVARLALVLLVAGLETTAATLNLSIATVLSHPQQAWRLTSNAKDQSAAIEELLRVTAATDFAAVRWAREPIEVGRYRIERGDGVVVSSTLANRDSSRVSEPGLVNLGNEERRPHLTFGHGIHKCVGQNLVRVQLEATIPLLLERLPGLALAGREDLVMRTDGTIQDLVRLEVTWETD